jgi:hypothetical protein
VGTDVLDQMGLLRDTRSSRRLALSPLVPTSVGGSRFWPRKGNHIRLQGILNGGRGLNRSSPRKTRQDKISPSWAGFLAGVVARILTEDALRNTVTHPYHLVALCAFKIVILGVMGPTTAVAARRLPPALWRRVVVPDFVAVRALYQGQGVSRPDEFNVPAEHTDPLTRGPLACGVVWIPRWLQ